MSEDKGGGLCSALNGSLIFEYLDGKEADFLYEEIFGRNCYVDFGIELNDSSIVLDVGANIGLFTMFCCHKYKNLTVVVVEPIPPIFDVLRRNVHSCQKNGNKIILYNAAVGAIDPTIAVETQNSVFSSESSSRYQRCDFMYIAETPGESTRHVEEMLSRQQTLMKCASRMDVPEVQEIVQRLDQQRNLDDTLLAEDNKIFSCEVIPLYEIIRRENLKLIDLLKIDVEGDELEVFLQILLI